MEKKVVKPKGPQIQSAPNTDEAQKTKEITETKEVMKHFKGMRK